MIGHVDDSLRALLKIRVASEVAAARHEIVVWVDTAFNGGLVIPRDQISTIGLAKDSTIEAILADGNSTELETFTCCLDWFGSVYETQVVANDAEYPLLGTMLLAGRKLEVDYKLQTVELS